MNGVDIASHQKDMDVTRIDADFVIIKITQGDYYVNPSFDKHFNEAQRSGRLIGAYHYSNGLDVSLEVEHLVSHLKPYLGKIIVCLDWESNDNINKNIQKGYNKEFKPSSEVDYVYKFVDLFYKKTGLYPFIYMSASVTRRSNWGIVAKNCPLWVAQYKDRELTTYQKNPYKDSKGLGAWKSEAIRQYTSSGTIKGYEQKEKGKLDLDKAYISKDEWLSYTKPVSKKKVTVDVVRDVLDGKYSSGQKRKENLEKAGYNYTEVQGKVNEIFDIVKKINDLKDEVGEYWDLVLRRI